MIFRNENRKSKNGTSRNAEQDAMGNQLRKYVLPCYENPNCVDSHANYTYWMFFFLNNQCLQLYVRRRSICRWLSDTCAACVHDLFSAFSSEDLLRISSLSIRRQSGRFWFRSALSLRGKAARSLRNSIPGSDSYEFSSFARIDGTLLGTGPRFPRVRSLARARGCPITGTSCPRKVSNGTLLHMQHVATYHARTYLPTLVLHSCRLKNANIVW